MKPGNSLTLAIIVTVYYSPVSAFSISTMAAAQQFAPQAVALFNNMKTPASIIAGAMIPLGFLAPVPIYNPDGSKNENRIETFMRRSYTSMSVLALLSEFISVVFATVAVNQLTETAVKPAASVWHLIQRDYDLSWSGTNAHFIFGMFSFAYLIAVKSYFNVGGGIIGSGVAGMAISSLLYMVGIVNRGVSSGSGDGISYGKSVLSLFRHYISLVLSQKSCFNPMELGSVAMLMCSLGIVVYGITRPNEK